jgi:hypothetical protein
MLDEGVDGNLRQGDDTVTRRRLRWCQSRRRSGHEEQLPVDGHLTTEEVDTVKGETEALTLSHAGGRSNHDQCSVVLCEPAWVS